MSTIWKRLRFPMQISITIFIFLLLCVSVVAGASSVQNGEVPPTTAGQNIADAELQEPPFTPKIAWQWQRGGNFVTMDAPTAGDIWLGGELLVHGVKWPNGNWTWRQRAPDITDRRSITALDFYDADHAFRCGE